MSKQSQVFGYSIKNPTQHSGLTLRQVIAAYLSSDFVELVQVLRKKHKICNKDLFFEKLNATEMDSYR